MTASGGPLGGLFGHRLVRSTLGVMGLGFGVKVLSLLKEMAVAGRLGVSREMDAFALAFGFACFLSNLLANNLNSAFIPSYARIAIQCNRSTARGLHGRVLWRLALALFGITLLIGLNLNGVVHWLAPRWSNSELVRLHAILRVLLLWVPISGLGFLSAATLQGEERFMVPIFVTAISPLAILALLAFSGSASALPLAWGLLLGGTAEGLTLAWVLRMTAPPPSSVDTHAISAALPVVWSQYLPALAAGILINTTPLVDMAIAGRLPPGAVATLAYANKIPAVAISLSAGALGTTLLPTLSRMAKEQAFAGIRRLIYQASALAMVAGALAALVFGLVSPWLVRLLFQRGAFHAAQTGAVASVQILYLLQLPFTLGGIVMVRLISALQGNRILLWGTVLTASLNLGLDLLFLPCLGARGIALSSACVALPTWLFLAFHALRLLRNREREASALGRPR